MNRQMEVVRLDRCKSAPTETRTFFWLAPEISALVWKSLKVSIRPFSALRWNSSHIRWKNIGNLNEGREMDEFRSCSGIFRSYDGKSGNLPSPFFCLALEFPRISLLRRKSHFVHGVSFDDFCDNEEKMFAVVRALEVVGEAARHIPKSMRDKYPEVPWKKVTGMRNKVTHEYFGVDLDVVWRTVHEDLPSLRDAVKKMLDDLEIEE